MLSLFGIRALPAFLSNPVFQIAAGLVAVVVAVAWLRHDAASDATALARAECVTQIATATEAERQRQRAVSRDALDQAARRHEEAEDKARELQETVDEISRQLETGRLTCPIPPALMRQLRAIGAS